jgi:hypothetical protein
VLIFCFTKNFKKIIFNQDISKNSKLTKKSRTYPCIQSHSHRKNTHWNPNQLKDLKNIWCKVWIWIKTSNDAGRDAVKKYFSMFASDSNNLNSFWWTFEHVSSLYQEHCVSKWWFQKADNRCNQFLFHYEAYSSLYAVQFWDRKLFLCINKKQSKNSTEADFFGMFNPMRMEKTVFEFINQALEKEKQNINYHKRAIIVSSCPFK